MDAFKINTKLHGIYISLVNTISSICELTPDDFYNSRCEICVIARTLLVEILTKKGLSERSISIISGMSQQRINHLKNSARYRLNNITAKMIREEIDKLCANQ